MVDSPAVFRFHIASSAIITTWRLVFFSTFVLIAHFVIHITPLIQSVISAFLKNRLSAGQRLVRREVLVKVHLFLIVVGVKQCRDKVPQVYEQKCHGSEHIENGEPKLQVPCECRFTQYLDKKDIKRLKQMTKIFIVLVSRRLLCFE